MELKIDEMNFGGEQDFCNICDTSGDDANLFVVKNKKKKSDFICQSCHHNYNKCLEHVKKIEKIYKYKNGN